MQGISGKNSGFKLPTSKSDNISGFKKPEDLAKFASISKTNREVANKKAKSECNKLGVTVGESYFKEHTNWIKTYDSVFKASAFLKEQQFGSDVNSTKNNKTIIEVAYEKGVTKDGNDLLMGFIMLGFDVAKLNWPQNSAQKELYTQTWNNADSFNDKPIYAPNWME